MRALLLKAERREGKLVKDGRRKYYAQDYVFAEAEAIFASDEALFLEIANMADRDFPTPRQKGALIEMRRRRLISEKIREIIRRLSKYPGK